MQVVVPMAILAFTLYCVLDVALTGGDRVRTLPKWTWLLLVVIAPVIGGVIWLVAGRPRPEPPEPGARRSHPSTRPGPARGTRSSPPGGRPTRPPRGPDDDPEFLRRLDERLRRRDDDGGG